jgi:NADPH2:quinone reductase
MGAALADLFHLVTDGTLRVVPGGEYGMSEVSQAHENLRARRTSGKLVLDPSR